MKDVPTRLPKEIADKFQVERNTFKRAVKENPKDKIEIEIGDSKQEDFKPQAKIMRWDNEVNFSIRAQEHPDARVETEGKLIKYITPEYEVHQYELDPGDIGEDGGLEFEWVLPSKPSTNVLTATIQTKGLDFFYQPALTQEEIEQGAVRPENVVGSYAVYHKTKGGMNRVDGMEYKTGKAFHIYRPKVKDANGSEVWGELNIDEQKGELTVTVPQEFLDSAAYPVVVDPTFGYTTGGSTNLGLAQKSAGGSPTSYKVGRTATPLEDGTLGSLSGYISASSTASFGVIAEVGDRDSSSTNNHAVVARTSENTVSASTTAGWKTVDFAGESFVSGNELVIDMRGDGSDLGSNVSVFIKYDSIFTDYSQIGRSSFTDSIFTNDPFFLFLEGGSVSLSIYATYTASGGGTFSTKTSQQTGAGATGSQSVTDPAFLPKALVVWNGLQTSSGGSTDAQWSLGVASDEFSEISAGFNSDDGTASSDVVRHLVSDKIIQNYTSGSTTLNISASLNNTNGSGFVLQWTDLTTTSPLFNYLAIGGSDITGSKSGSFTANTSTGNQAVTGVGFQPEVVLLFTQLQTSSGVSNNNSCYSFGAFDASGNQWAMGVGLQNGQATMNNRRTFRVNRCVAVPSAGSNIYESEASFVSMDVDGFTINWSDAPGAGYLVGYLAMAGGQWKVGNITQKTSTGTQAYTGVGFQPAGVMFGSHCDTDTSSVIDNARLMFGASTGASNNTALWTGDSDNVADAVADTIMSATKCVVMATEGTPTTNAEADLDSFDSDGFTLDWTTADATARAIGYIAFAGEPVVGGGTSVVAGYLSTNTKFW